MNKFDLSVVIPLYNEEVRFPKSFKKIEKFFLKQKINLEYLFIDDGSSDRTLQMLKSLKPNYPHRILRNKLNSGKGAALQKGILSANGYYIFFTDADLSTPIKEFTKLYKSLKDFDVVIASRRIPGSNVLIKQPLHRRSLGELFYLLFNTFFIKEIKDPNCGFKCFKSKTAKILFNTLLVKRWGYDTEILYRAYKAGYKIKEVPVTWLNSSNSKVAPLTAIALTLYELYLIKSSVKSHE